MSPRDLVRSHDVRSATKYAFITDDVEVTRSILGSGSLTTIATDREWVSVLVQKDVDAARANVAGRAHMHHAIKQLESQAQ